MPFEKKNYFNKTITIKKKKKKTKKQKSKQETFEIIGNSDRKSTKKRTNEVQSRKKGVNFPQTAGNNDVINSGVLIRSNVIIIINQFD